MKCSTSKNLARVFILILFFNSLASFPQSSLDLDSQMDRMKQDYQTWLSTRSQSRLFVEYDPSPMALDIPEPRFTWIVDLEGKERAQIAYQILVASERELLNEDYSFNNRYIAS